MPKRETKAQWEARQLARTHAMWATNRAALRLYRPDLANLRWVPIEPGEPGRPDWFQRIVWDCEAAARDYAHEEACLESDGPAYNAAYIESYAEAFPILLKKAAFPILLKKALAKHDKPAPQPWD